MGIKRFAAHMALAVVAAGAGVLATVAPAHAVSGTVELKNVKTGRCLETLSWNTANFASVGTWSCYGGTIQQWMLLDTGNGVQLINRHTNKCLEVLNYSTSAGATLGQYDCYQGNNQLWYMEFYNSNGKAWRWRNKHSGLCISADTAWDGAVASQMSCNTNTRVMWRVNWQ